MRSILCVVSPQTPKFVLHSPSSVARKLKHAQRLAGHRGPGAAKGGLMGRSIFYVIGVVVVVGAVLAWIF